MKESACRILFSALLFVGVCLASGCADSAAGILGPSTAEELDLPALASVPAAETELSVAAAYEAIPHRRTEFDFSATEIDSVESEYLRIAFRVVEEGTRSRVALLQALSHDQGTSARSVARSLRRAGQLAEFWGDLTPPGVLESYHRDIGIALDNQLSFFRAWAEAGEDFSYKGRALARAPEVQASSQALHHAYDRLMRRYPGESAGNRDAFFDYHCALDFL